MKTVFVSVVSVALLSLLGGLAAPAHAGSKSTFHNPRLTAVIHAQGELAVKSIEAQAKTNLLAQIRTLDMPGVELGPTELVEEIASNQPTSDPTTTQLEMQLWIKAVLSNSERDLYHALSLARFIVIDVPVKTQVAID